MCTNMQRRSRCMLVAIYDAHNLRHRTHVSVLFVSSSFLLIASILRSHLSILSYCHHSHSQFIHRYRRDSFVSFVSSCDLALACVLFTVRLFDIIIQPARSSFDWFILAPRLPDLPSSSSSCPPCFASLRCCSPACCASRTSLLC